jgi:hypothetical protein
MLNLLPTRRDQESKAANNGYHTMVHAKTSECPIYEALSYTEKQYAVTWEDDKAIRTRLTGGHIPAGFYFYCHARDANDEPCEYETHKAHYLRDHLRINKIHFDLCQEMIPEQVHTCDFGSCKKQTFLKTEMTKHKKSHEAAQFQCNCNKAKTYKTEKILMKHIAEANKYRGVKSPHMQVTADPASSGAAGGG